MVPRDWLGPQPSFREFHAYSCWLLRTLLSWVAFSARDWPISHTSRLKHDVRIVVPVGIFDTDRHQDVQRHQHTLHAVSHGTQNIIYILNNNRNSVNAGTTLSAIPNVSLESNL